MLKLYTGYNLGNIQTQYQLTFDNLTLEEEIVQDIQQFIDLVKGKDATVKTNSSFNIEVLRTLMLEQGLGDQLQIIYIDKDLKEHVTTLTETGDWSQYPHGLMATPMNIVNRRYRYHYEQKYRR